MSGEHSVKFLISDRLHLSGFISLFAAAAFFFIPAQTAFSQVDDKSPENTPLHIVSDKMVAQKDQSVVEFIGNVKATQTDSVVSADSIKVFFMSESEQKQAKNNVKKIVSTGNVEYRSGDRKAYADKAVYTTEDETLILTGDSPKLVTGSSFVTGKKITLFRNQDKVLVESDGKRRVEALFNPEDSPADTP